MRFPWQLSATSRAMMAVFPKPMFPTITTPRLVDGSSLRRQASTSWKSHSLPVNSQSDSSPGTSKRRGLRLRHGVNRTAEGEWRKYYFQNSCVLRVHVCEWLYVFTSMVLLTSTPRILSGHSEWRPGWDVSLLLVQVGQILQVGWAGGCTERTTGSAEPHEADEQLSDVW